MKIRLFPVLALLLFSSSVYAQTKRALIIGVGKYPKESQFSSISALNDLRHLSVALPKFGFADSNIIILKDSTATKEGIINSIRQLIEISERRDIIFLHFSVHGYSIIPSSARLKKNRDYLSTFKTGSFLVPYSKCPAFKEDPVRECGYESWLNIDEVITLVNDLRRKVGEEGQVVLTVDAEVGAQDATKGNNVPRGGLFDEHTNIFKNEAGKAPFIFLSPTNSFQVSFELMDEDGRGVGPLSYAFSKAALAKDSSNIQTFKDLHNRITEIIRNRFPMMVPTIAGDVNQNIFENGNSLSKSSKINTQKFIPEGDCYIVSIGIDHYQSSGAALNSMNASGDAARIAKYVGEKFSSIAAGAVHKFVQVTESSFYGKINYQLGSKDSVINCLNAVINQSKENDYFIFNFSGASIELTDLQGQKEIYFLTSDIADITDTIAIKRSAISLKMLKDLFELIPANNQLIITEAGSTANFQRQFVKKLFESAPAIQSLSKRNRVIVVPNGVGYDRFSCGDVTVQGGPLIYSITNLPDHLNLFSVFDTKPEAEKIEFAIRKREVECLESRETSYTQFFFEKQFIEELSYYLADQVGLSRSGRVSSAEKASIQRTIRKKHALIIGTNTYAGKPEWSDLNNPIPDATAIADELESNYGFEVKRLLNPSTEDVYEALYYYANELDSNDQFFVFVAGHGDFDSTFFDDGLLVFANSFAYKNDRFKKSYIKYGELQKIINQYRAQSVFIMLDVCFGGTFDARIAQQFRTKTDEYAPLENTTFLSEKLKFRSRIYMTSGGKNVVPDGYNKQHSPFAKQFLKALRDATERGILTTSNIYSYVETLPSEPKKGTFGSDQPGSEFIFITTKKN